MSIPWNPSLSSLSLDPLNASPPSRRIVLNPPDDYLASATAQLAAAAGRAPAPFSAGPLLFAPDGQAVVAAPPAPLAQGSWAQPAPAVPGAEGVSGPGAGAHEGTGMGMGVGAHDQQGLDQGWLDSVRGQLAAGRPGSRTQPQPQTPTQDPQGSRDPQEQGSAPQTPVNAPVEPEQGAFSVATAPATPTDPAALSPTLASIAAVSDTAQTAVVVPSTTELASSISDAVSASLASASSSSTSIADATVSASASASPSDSAAAGDAPSKPFTQSTAFILLIVLCSLALFGILATALRWVLRWRAKDGQDRYLGGLLASRRRDVEADDLSDIVRSFGSTPTSRRGSANSGLVKGAGGGEYPHEYAEAYEYQHQHQHGDGVEKRSSLLAEEMGNAPFLHSGDGMETVDLGSDGHEHEHKLPPVIGCAATRRGADGSPLLGAGDEYQRYGTTRLEVRNRSEFDDEGEDRARTLPRSWVADRALANIAGWARSRSSQSIRSSTMNSNASLPSPFASHDIPASPSATALLHGSASGSGSGSGSGSSDSGSEWPRSASQCPSVVASSVGSGLGTGITTLRSEDGRGSTWASNLRSSLFAAISGGVKLEDDKFTRPILPLHASTFGHAQGRALSRASSARSMGSGASRARSVLGSGGGGGGGGGGDATFGRAAGKEVDVDVAEGDDAYSLSSSAKGDIRQAMLLGEKGVSRQTSDAAPSSLGIGERYKVFARGSRGRGRVDEVDLL